MLTSLNVSGACWEVWSDMLGWVGGIVVALWIMFTGWTVVDAIIAVLIGLWVLPRTWKLLREAGQVLMQGVPAGLDLRSEEHTSELQSLMRISYAVFCLTKKNKKQSTHTNNRLLYNLTKLHQQKRT